MTATELILGTFSVIAIILVIVTIITMIITKTSTKEIQTVKNVYIEKLANSDSSIQNAMKYLKLTNGLEQSN